MRFLKKFANFDQNLVDDKFSNFDYNKFANLSSQFANFDDKFKFANFDDDFANL